VAQPVLMVIITIMVTISIRPYSLRKIAFIGLALFCLSCLSAFAQSAYITVNSTPYDRQMTRIRPILSSASRHKDESISISLVNHWIGNLRAIPYGFSTEWKTPEEVQLGAYADCKGKAVALYNAMHSRGVENVRLVIGKRLWSSHKTHAWLEWTTDGGTYILDPTINWVAQAVNEIPENSYVPYYAYSGSRKYRAAAATSLYARL